MRRTLALAVVAATGCAPALRPVPATAPTLPAEVRIARAKELARAADHAPEPAQRERLAVEAVETAQPCGTRPDCAYWLAVAIGLQAREKPTTAADGIPRMLALLAKAEAGEPALERGGPARVAALVLLRAPGWPLGPGDPEAGLESARRAIAIDPEYPPNRLALAEALMKTGDRGGGEEEARAAAEAARGWDDPDAADWARDAERLLSSR
ncbi:MAG TPA: hypothetical protein VF139_18140 [Candidatus Polarisedimenticolaceae bacterium]